jgi:hypothetical protein
MIQSISQEPNQETHSPTTLPNFPKFRSDQIHAQHAGIFFVLRNTSSQTKVPALWADSTRAHAYDST